MHTRPYSVRQTVSVALIAALLPATAFANGTRLPNQGTEAAARGNAFVATADNPSAIYYNPAGITQLEGVQLQSDNYLIEARYDYRRTAGSPTVEAASDPSLIPQLYATWTPDGSRLSYGLGLYSPFGQSTDWPDNTGFRTQATLNEVIFITVAPTIAWKISDNLSIGAGLQINRVDADLRRGLAPVPGNEFRFTGDDTSLGYNLGVLWRVNERHVFGLSYQSRSTSHLDGEVTFTPPGASAPAEAGLAFPDIITAGYSWRPTPAWNIELGVDRTNWDLLNSTTLRAPSVPLTVPIRFDWEASYYYLLGVTRHLSDGWRVSAGYCYSENSVPDSTFNPAVPDMSRHLASIGVGRKLGALDLFLMYQHGFRASRDVTGAPPGPPPFNESADGRYRSELDAIGLSFRYSF